ncbi:Nif3-like dinuclear metal center hexameric protein [Paenibacillus psychroresistens]|uniref:GTP cyclohydrolase 1 type 2 homolog n=1 Tax=Paenibacillus psychroresistens TaxID=1778678 RepID=A0A6B8RW05_9BACL|nr:Nif3-like dinuclear metal center hexameric protein [Paenibacillus psychroresistens]QGR00108.1 Nif3-like dinuclear metal center hexameric protein [Paenibacillus psychroresistens]
METTQFKKTIEMFFGNLLTQFEEGDEFAFYDYGPKVINRIGYSTNITPEIVIQAQENKVDLIITHHDAWDFVFGMKEKCHTLLKEYGISHFFVHLPLDYAEFGTCSSMFKALGINELIQQSNHHEGRSIPGVGEFKVPITFEQLNEKIRIVLNEDIKSWKNSEKIIKRVGMITGAGNSTKNLRDALDARCDVYITGEKILYTIQYAKFVGMNLIVGSHTFTEIFGVKTLTEKLKEKFIYLDIVELIEEHFE